jgi:hypothetical protein
LIIRVGNCGGLPPTQIIPFSTSHAASTPGVVGQITGNRITVTRI